MITPLESRCESFHVWRVGERTCRRCLGMRQNSISRLANSNRLLAKRNVQQCGHLHNRCLYATVGEHAACAQNLLIIQKYTKINRIIG